MLYCRNRISVPMFDIASGIQISSIRHPDIWYPNITYQISGVGIQESESRSRYPGVGIQVSGAKMLIFHWKYVVFLDFSKKKKSACGVETVHFSKIKRLWLQNGGATELRLAATVSFFSKNVVLPRF